MNTETEPKIDKDLYINEATLELLRRRIEADVKKGFFKSIGAPVGGAGVIAILYVLFSWIPTQLEKMIEGMPSIQRTVQGSVNDYLQDEKKGQKFIREQVDLNSEKFVSSAVDDYMASEMMARILRTGIEDKTTAYYKSKEGEKQVDQLIKSHMSSAAVQQQIRDAVDKALSPVLGSLSRDIETSFSSLVYDIPKLAGTEQVDKESLGKLIEFLGSSRAAAIKTSGSPVVLTFAIGQGHYVLDIIELYISRLQEEYTGQFKHVAIVDQNKKFLALLPVMPFLTDVRKDNSLLKFLNGENGNMAAVMIREKFGHTVERQIQTDDVVQEVLQTKSLWEPTTHTGFVAVVGEMGELVGITNRRKIIDGCLEQLSA